MPVTIDGTAGITTPDLESTGPVTGTTGVFSGNVTANGLTTELRPLVIGTSQSSASGTAIDFTGIPSWVKRVTVIFSGVSTNGSSPPLVQIGDSGGNEVTGYAGSATTVGSSSVNGGLYNGSGFQIVAIHVASYTIHGSMTIVNLTGNTWVASGAFGLSDTSGTTQTAGSKTLSATLDRIRITTVNGTDTFDAGTINIMYE